jgi:DNA polymerase II large subunit
MASCGFHRSPTVRLRCGDVVRIDDTEEAHRLHPKLEYIIDIGEILINYGDILENNHVLVPSSYCFECWIQDYSFATGEDGSAKPELKHPSQELALEICEKHNVPLHPDFTYLWHDITTNDFVRLAEFIEEHGSLDEKLSVLSLPRKLSADSGIKILLENMWCCIKYMTTLY